MNNREIYSVLKEEFLQNPTLGNITFNTGIGEVIIKERDIIGNSIQSWLGSWLTEQNVEYSLPRNTQSFPDYIINPGTNEQENLEVKSWYGSTSPGFDIANFGSYVDTLQQDSSKLDADYLIFKYNVDDDGEIRIEDVYLKKIWEITCPSNSYPLKVQAKRGMIYNIRPATWYSDRSRYLPFNNRDMFVRALSDTLILSSDSNSDAMNWYEDISSGYLRRTGRAL